MHKNICFNAGLIVECPYCKHLVRFAEHGKASRVISTDDAARREYWKLYQCQICQGGVMFWYRSKDENNPVGGIYTTFPNYVPEMPADVAGKVADIFKEALTCYGAQAWNAVGTMCRRAVEEIMTEKGATGSSLYAKIQDAATKLTLPKDLVDLAHHIRIIGRDGAHANDPQSNKVFIDLTKEDADDSVEFCRILFEYLYGMQARLSRAKGKRPN